MPDDVPDVVHLFFFCTMTRNRCAQQKKNLVSTLLNCMETSSKVLNGCGLASCPNSGTKICTKCRIIRYCSVACQKTDWPHHKQGCKPIQEEDKKSSDVKLTLQQQFGIVAQMGNNKALALDLIEYCLPKILSCWNTYPSTKGAVNIIFSSFADVQRVLDAYQKMMPLKDIAFSITISFSSPSRLIGNPLLGLDSVEVALANGRYFATVAVEIPKKEGFLTMTLTEFRVNESGQLVRSYLF